jgi:hypothetical protein
VIDDKNTEEIQVSGNVAHRKLPYESLRNVRMSLQRVSECFLQGCGRFLARELIAHMDKESADARLTNR